MTNQQTITDARTLATHDEIRGIVRMIIFRDEDNGQTIAQLSDGTTIKGETDGDGLDCGSPYRFFGRFRDHSRYGRQFHFDSVVADTPLTRSGVVKYIATTCTGIGQAIAGRMWHLYGAGAIDTLAHAPRNVAADLGIDVYVCDSAAQQLKDDARFVATRVDLIGLFSGRGFSKATIAACIARWGVLAGKFVRRDPFVMLVNEIPGCGWKRCDGLYLSLGGNPARLKRQMLAGWHALREDSSGNTWSMFGVFHRGVTSAIGDTGARPEDALQLGIRAGWLRERTTDTGLKLIAEKSKADNESDLAHHVRRLMKSTPDPWPHVNPPQVSAHQAGQFAAVVDSPIGLVTGTPGTGKTFLTAAVLREVVATMGRESIAVCAPTGKAAVRITETMAKAGLDLQATTIHRLLGIGRNGHDGKGWEFTHNESNPLPFRVVVCDEASMLDTDLAASLVRAISTGSRLLLVGDPHQLPPVGHGAPLRDLLQSSIPCASLVEIQRNSGAIVRACRDIKDGHAFETCTRINRETGDNLIMIEADDPEAQILALARVVDQVQRGGTRDPIWDMQVLTPTNDSGKIGRKQLNTLLQGHLNPLVGEKSTSQVGEFRLDDKIICLKNCELDAWERTSNAPLSTADGWRPAKGRDWKQLVHYVANGDQGAVVYLDVEKQAIIVKWQCPERVTRIPLAKTSTTDRETGAVTSSDFTLAYCVTGHKSQGSEWPLVVVMIDEAGSMVASREWIYTAISRAKDACILIGKRRVIDRQCQRVVLPTRRTFLKELLQER